MIHKPLRLQIMWKPTAWLSSPEVYHDLLVLVFGINLGWDSAVNYCGLEVWGPKGKEVNPSQPRKPIWPVSAGLRKSKLARSCPEQLCHGHQIWPLCTQHSEFGLQGEEEQFPLLLAVSLCYPGALKSPGGQWGWCDLAPCHIPYPWSHWPTLLGTHWSRNWPWLYLIQQALTHHVAWPKNNIHHGGLGDS